MVAAKVFSNPTADELQAITLEAEIMSEIEPHPNILSIHGVIFSAPPPLMIVLEYCKYGSLEHVQQKKKRLTSLSTKLQVACDVACGMESLVSQKILHRDLAARNVLLGTNLIAKVADFGLSRDMTETNRGGKVYYVSRGLSDIAVQWTSPEALFDKRFSEQSDAWSYGMLLQEIFTDGERPYGNNTSVEEVIRAILNGRHVSQAPSCPASIYALQLECWNFAPHQRPSFNTIVGRCMREISVEPLPHVNASVPQPLIPDEESYADSNFGGGGWGEDYCTVKLPGELLADEPLISPEDE
jgi:tyrosine-protein kinase Srms